MDALKMVCLFVLGGFGIYCFFRIAALAIAKSWKQIMHNKEEHDCNKNQPE